ncbi:MAG TPA: trypsin-like serine protease, partial [Candidatus Thermoplasmatota archaeon]|nr:trypsin-like serine protease [Candidatus Thermoplasmatota archaeon]
QVRQVGAPFGRIAEHPYAVFIVQATLYYEDGALVAAQAGGMCSGSLIGAHLVLTAAHCVEEGVGWATHGPYDVYATYVIVQGAPDALASSLPRTARVSLAKTAAPSPGWSGEAPDHDVGLIELLDHLPLPLPSYPLVEGLHLPFVPDPALLVGATVTVASFGSSTVGPARLGRFQVGQYTVVPASECTQQWGARENPDHLLCARGKPPVVDACGGDSGAPVLAARAGRTVIVAVISAGSPQCHLGLPGMSARVAPILLARTGAPVVPEPPFGALSSAAEPWHRMEVQATHTGQDVVLPTAPLAMRGRSATLWQPGFAPKDVQVQLTGGVPRIPLRSLQVGVEALLEMPTSAGGQPTETLLRFRLDPREPQVDVWHGLDASGVPKLQGVVLDQHGAPMQRVRIIGSIAEAPRLPLQATTSADGTFLLPLRGLGPGEYNLSLSVPAQTRSLITAGTSDWSFTIVGREPVTSPEVRFVSGKAMLVGRLEDQDGQPIARHPLEVQVHVDGQPPRLLKASTGPDGAYQVPLAGIPAGVHAMSVLSPADTRKLLLGRGFVAPLAIEERQAHPELEVGLVRGRPSLAGTILDQDGEPMPRRSLTLTVDTQPRPSTIRGTTDASGAFALPLRLPAGSYEAVLHVAADARHHVAPSTHPFTLEV